MHGIYAFHKVNYFTASLNFVVTLFSSPDVLSICIFQCTFPLDDGSVNDYLICRAAADVPVRSTMKSTTNATASRKNTSAPIRYVHRTW